jgi:hypothetical protein
MLFYMLFLLVQIVNKMGLQKKIIDVTIIMVITQNRQ